MGLLLGSPALQAAVTGSGILVGKDDVTITWPRVFVSGDQWGVTLDGTLMTETFATTSNAMLDAIVADFVAITGSVAAARVMTYFPRPRITVYGLIPGHELLFTLPTGTADLQAPSTVIEHSGVREIGLVVANALDLLTAVIVDDTSTANYTYVGRALAGTSSSAYGWSIQRINTTSATAPVIEWAAGTTDNIHLWSARTSLSYS